MDGYTGHAEPASTVSPTPRTSRPQMTNSIILRYMVDTITILRIWNHNAGNY